MLEFLEQLLSVQEEVQQGTVFCSSDVQVEIDAEHLRKAMKGLGTDEDVIIEITAKRSNSQRQEIKNAYKQLYGRDLTDDLESELSGNFSKVICSLYETPLNYDVKCLHDAMKGIGTSEDVLIEILASRTDAEIREIRAAYKQRYGRELEADLQGDTSGDFRRLLVSLCNADRESDISVDPCLAQCEANALFGAGEARCGTDEEVFNRVLCKRSYAQLRATFNEYYKIADKDITCAIESEFSGDIKHGLLAIVAVARCRPAYFASQLYKSMKGLGTDDSTLVRVIVSRSEKDLCQVQKAFNIMYSERLREFISDDISGDYKKICLALI